MLRVRVAPDFFEHSQHANGRGGWHERQAVESGSHVFSIIQAAGWPIWPLLLASVIALALIVERFLSLKRSKVLPPKLYDEALSVAQQRRATPEVVNTLEQNSPLGRVLAAGLRHVVLQPHTSRDAAKEVVEEAGRAVAHELERYLNALGTIASVAPLMGLLGTVIGMIEIFGSQTPQGGNPLVLAHGISIALYNTAFGLVVAVPSMIFYRYFRAKVDALLVDMEMQAIKLVEIIHGERQA